MAIPATPGPSDDDIHAPADVRPAPPADRPHPPDPATPTRPPHRDGDDTTVNGPHVTGPSASASAQHGALPRTPAEAIHDLHAAGVPAPTLALAVPFLVGWSADSGIQPTTVPLPPCPTAPDDRIRAIIPHHTPRSGLHLPPPGDAVVAPARPARPDGCDRSDPTREPESRSPDVPHHLPTGRLQVSAQPRRAANARHTPAASAAPPTPPHPAPPPQPSGAAAFRRWSQNFVQALIEALDGERPLRQLERWVHPEVYRALNRLDRRPGPDRRRGRRRAALRSLRITHPVPGVAEVAAIYTRAGDRAQRCHVAALRIEPGSRGWLCTAVSLG